MARIHAGEDPRCAGDDPLLETGSSGSRDFVEVEAELTGGWREAVRVEQVPGRPCRELSWDDLAAEFMDCAAQAHIDPSRARPRPPLRPAKLRHQGLPQGR